MQVWLIEEAVYLGRTGGQLGRFWEDQTLVRHEGPPRWDDNVPPAGPAAFASSVDYHQRGFVIDGDVTFPSFGPYSFHTTSCPLHRVLLFEEDPAILTRSMSLWTIVPASCWLRVHFFSFASAECEFITTAHLIYQTLPPPLLALFSPWGSIYPNTSQAHKYREHECFISKIADWKVAEDDADDGSSLFTIFGLCCGVVFLKEEPKQQQPFLSAKCLQLLLSAQWSHFLLEPQTSGWIQFHLLAYLHVLSCTNIYIYM